MSSFPGRSVLLCPLLYTPLPVQSMDRGIPYYTLGFLCSKYRLILRELPESNSVIVTPVCLGISSFTSVTRTQNLLKMYFWSSLLCTPSGVHPRFSYSFPWLSHICASHVIKRRDNWTLLWFFFFLQVAPVWGLGLLSTLWSQGEFNLWYLIHHQAHSQAL